MNRVLVVDDEAGMRAALEAHFLRRNWGVDTAANAGEAIEKFRRVLHPLVVTDIRMPGADGFSVMREARSLSPHTAVILLTAFANIPDAVTAMKGGACDYLVKPVSFEQLEQAAERILAEARTQADAAEGLAGHAPAWLRALDRARQAAASSADVLIEAESGTGKELVARLIHRLSSRRDHSFVAINCSAFPETLLESELFGYARGAFTGAVVAKPGRFELAHRGTLLLDEVGEMPLGLQPKLLRVLQEREFDRLGDTRAVRVDVRVISTTNRTLSDMVREGKFRADLFYRLNVIPLSVVMKPVWHAGSKRIGAWGGTLAGRGGGREYGQRRDYAHGTRRSVPAATAGVSWPTHPALPADAGAFAQKSIRWRGARGADDRRPFAAAQPLRAWASRRRCGGLCDLSKRESGDGDGRLVERGACLSAQCRSSAGRERDDSAIAADSELGALLIVDC